MWEQHAKFFPMLEEAWKASGACGTVEGLNDKLGNMSRVLVDWGTREFGHVRKKLRCLKAELQALRSVQERVGPSDQERWI